MKANKLRILPLGGLGEVGRNMMVYEYGGEILVVDTGLMFPENDMHGVDYIIPDISYLIERRNKVRGIIITHGHEDHTGAIKHVLAEVNAPVYATPLTRGLLEVKLGKQGGLDRANLHTVQAGDTVQVGPFKVEFFHVCHSIPDGVGLGITTPVGLIVHQSDYKFDHTPVDNWPSDYAKLAEFSQRGVLALLADSTNAERPGWTPSERVIDGAFDTVFRETEGRIILASFASLISRMQQVAAATERYGRKLAFVGTSMQDNMKMARKLGYLDIDDKLIVSIEQALTMPDKDVVIMCTGSQGEPTSIMGRLSTGTNRLFDIKPGDTVVLSSHPIPGEKVATSFVFVEGSSVGEVDEDVMAEREVLARDGIVLVNLTLDRFSGSLRRDPQISSRGFLLSRDSDSLLVEARKRVQNLLNGSVNGNLAKDVEKELGNLFYSETHRRPIVYVTVARE